MIASRHPATTTAPIDLETVRSHFLFPASGRLVTNNAASTQPPRELVAMYESLAPSYDNVHRGQSSASRVMTAAYEDAYDTIARFINAPSRRNLAVYRNTTEAHNAVMYTLFTEFQDGDNVVTTLMEHNSNYVPWYAMCREILPRFGRRVEYRLVRFNPMTGELDLDHLRSLVDERTKLVCCTGASNFFGTKNPLGEVRAIASASGYVQPNGDRRSYLLVDGAQLVPSTAVDVEALDVDFLSFSFHKLMAPFGVGVLYAKEQLLETTRPFLYGGDMIAEGQVFPDRVAYNDLPWKYMAGTPNILGTIISAQAMRILLDLVLSPRAFSYFGTDRPVTHDVVAEAMTRVTSWTRQLTAHAIDRLSTIPRLTMYGPRDASHRTALVAFNVQDRDPIQLANALNDAGVESRAGCHCATLAHHQLALDPPASCRLSFYFYNTMDEVDRAADALDEIVRSGL